MPARLQLEHHRQLDHVHAQRHVAHALGIQYRLDLLGRVAEQGEVGAVAPRSPSIPGAAMVVVQPGRVQLVVPGGRAEIPDVGVAVPGQQRIARELVARPFADHGAGGVADVVLVEGQQRTQPGIGQRRARAREAVVVQPAEIDALLEIDLGMPRRADRPIPLEMRIDVVGLDDLRFACFLLRHGCGPFRPNARM